MRLRCVPAITHARASVQGALNRAVDDVLDSGHRSAALVAELWNAALTGNVRQVQRILRRHNFSAGVKHPGPVPPSCST